MFIYAFMYSLISAAQDAAPRKRAKGRGGGGDAEISPALVCELLGFASLQTSRAAESYWRRSEAARNLGSAGAVR